MTKKAMYNKVYELMEGNTLLLGVGKYMEMENEYRDEFVGGRIYLNSKDDRKTQKRFLEMQMLIRKKAKHIVNEQEELKKIILKNSNTFNKVEYNNNIN